MKSERLKKLEKELAELKKWLDLDLVPKKDKEKHTVEMQTLQNKIDEEKKRLDYLKPNSDVEDFVMPKRGAAKQAYEPQSMPDIEFDKNSDNSNFDMDNSTTFEADHTTLFDIEMAGGKDRATAEFEAEDDPFSDKNRWKRTKDLPEDDFDDAW
ncbi:MAG: hypothetical protein S4CHLAM20_01030 [Chlamydiia bacterium]|nr:hypothetical protein [Chlamydiia bacterium]